MMSFHPPQMHASSAIHFRDPFLPLDHYHPTPLSSWSTSTAHLTPRPEMNQEHGYHYGDVIPSRQPYQVTTAPYLPHEASYPNSMSRPISPVRQPVFEESVSRRGSCANIIASPFQIPRSVNDSGGSLSELAAQITCLFWFESVDQLQLVEDSTLPPIPSRQLIQDARPTTGFRKWVTTILSTTLVAQNVVLLALLFVYRLKKLNPTVKGKPGSEYRLLTVALMLGNKFLDDNTYTNKTWAEVSGINVNEIHIMEVEFLSNMKYCLFTSAEDWSKWQSLLGRFASFFERATRPYQPAPHFQPALSFQPKTALPSPPSSNQASPPYCLDARYAAASSASLGPTPAPSPLSALSAYEGQYPYQNYRKRSFDVDSIEHPAKRIAMTQNLPPHSHLPAQQILPYRVQPESRPSLPSLPLPDGRATSGRYSQQLPPLHVPARNVGLQYPSVCNSGQMPGSAAPASIQARTEHSSNQPSPFGSSANASPCSTFGTTGTRLHPATQISPSYFLQQRSSPYRPVRNVSTLLYPPPSGALHEQPSSVEHKQMAYQQLGKPIQQRQSGLLPYVSQNIWLDGNAPHAMTPVHQWPGFTQDRQPSHLPPRH